MYLLKQNQGKTMIYERSLFVWVGGERCGWVTDCEKNCLKEILGQI